jgi:hypothetical protein
MCFFGFLSRGTTRKAFSFDFLLVVVLSSFMLGEGIEDLYTYHKKQQTPLALGQGRCAAPTIAYSPE